MHFDVSEADVLPAIPPLVASVSGIYRIGGLLGTHVCARVQKFLPERLIRGFLGVLIAALGLQYVVQFFL